MLATWLRKGELTTVKPLPLSRTIVALAFWASSDLALSFDYFRDPIEYWKNDTSETEEKSASPKARANGKKKFEWKKALDPMDDSLDFFREGDYVPPRAFIELTRDPNDQNIKNWFKLMQTKNDLATRLQSRMQAYVQKNQIPQPLALEYQNAAAGLKPQTASS